MAAPRNVFKDRLRSQQLGLFATLNSPALAELLAACGFDWILIDTEHSPGEMADVVAPFHALQGREVSVIVRPAWSDMVLIKRLLDAGTQTLLLPNVQTAQEAPAAVSYARYHPGRGTRGFQRFPGRAVRAERGLPADRGRADLHSGADRNPPGPGQSGSHRAGTEGGRTVHRPQRSGGPHGVPR